MNDPRVKIIIPPDSQHLVVLDLDGVFLGFLKETPHYLRATQNSVAKAFQDYREAYSWLLERHK